jgi:HK97 family phage prohead protease
MTNLQLRGALLRADERKRQVTFRANTDALDRHGTIIKPLGIRTEHFARNPILAWGHDAYGSLFKTPDPANIIGRVVDWTATASAFDVVTEFAPAAVNERAEMVYQLVKQGFVNGVSIGFRALKWHDEQRAGREIRVLDEVELLEVSVVPIPSNPEAVAVARAWAQLHGWVGDVEPAGDGFVDPVSVARYTDALLTGSADEEITAADRAAIREIFRPLHEHLSAEIRIALAPEKIALAALEDRIANLDAHLETLRRGVR